VISKLERVIQCVSEGRSDKAFYSLLRLLLTTSLAEQRERVALAPRRCLRRLYFDEERLSFSERRRNVITNKSGVIISNYNACTYALNRVSTLPPIGFKQVIRVSEFQKGPEKGEG
jgi:hypothetical protein